MEKRDSVFNFISDGKGSDFREKKRIENLEIEKWMNICLLHNAQLFCPFVKLLTIMLRPQRQNVMYLHFNFNIKPSSDYDRVQLNYDQCEKKKELKKNYRFSVAC